MKRYYLIFLFLPIILYSQNNLTPITFNKNAKIEVGSNFIGVEFHKSRPFPQRISFYYPLANSIDVSTDYWYRDTSFVIKGILEFDDEKIDLTNELFPFKLTPFSVDFKKEYSNRTVKITYHYTDKTRSAIITYTIINKSGKSQNVKYNLENNFSLKTSHTFAYKNDFKFESKENKLFVAEHLSNETGKAALYILYPEEKPTNAKLNQDWLSQNFVKEVAPGDSLSIVQIIGSCKKDELINIANDLEQNYLDQIKSFEQNIISKISSASTFTTGDEKLDRSVLWAKAILETNKHYIDGDIEPMPCPAEYNFYFTHDVLLTDLAAVKFDKERVKNDLNFIMKHSDDSLIIPHAYYWKDSAFVTEYANHDNWNNFWFIITVSEYLKYTNDSLFIKKLMPYAKKSMMQALKTKGDDDLMWSYRPDWWDIGRRYGQRSYMTLLSIKAIRSYLYLASNFRENNSELTELENIASRMEVSLNSVLWNKDYNYLMNNIEPTLLDKHFYAGSLLAAHFNVIDKDKLPKLITTAKSKLVDNKIGVYTVYPMDFDNLQDEWHLANNESGPKYQYMNGGIWPHLNVWYALALARNNEKEEAINFIKNTMTIDGIMEGPNGQPSMYEVRNSNKENPSVYGTIDKPQFMWAGGWYLYSLYHILGIDNSDWNITFSPYIPVNSSKISFDLNINSELANVTIKRSEKFNIIIDGKKFNSLVVPKNIKVKNVDISCGNYKEFTILECNSRLEKIDEGKEIIFTLSAFKGHNSFIRFYSPKKPEAIFIDNNKVEPELINGEYMVYFSHSSIQSQIRIKE
ncbi:MAG: hypothetical protein M0P71_02595 [Melioribacteraceae bacterium]|nr:hypothetical protein [Melioribacteraceae bacterium]